MNIFAILCANIYSLVNLHILLFCWKSITSIFAYCILDFAIEGSLKFKHTVAAWCRQNMCPAEQIKLWQAAFYINTFIPWIIHWILFAVIHVIIRLKKVMANNVFVDLLEEKHNKDLFSSNLILNLSESAFRDIFSNSLKVFLKF